MKKTKTIAACAGLLATVILPACNSTLPSAQEVAAPLTQGQGTLILELKRAESPALKSGDSFTAAENYETQFNSTQILVFDKSSGKLEKYLYDDGGGASAELTVPTGEKTVWAVANFASLESTQTESELKERTLALDDNSVSAEEGFVLSGSNTADVQPGQMARCTVQVSRMVSRVALSSVTNSMPSAYTVVLKRAFLANVAGNANLGMTAAVDTWLNPMGRCNESPLVASHIINGSTYKASSETLTYADLSSAGQVAKGASHSPSKPYLFYSYPNSVTAEPSGFTSSFSGSKAALVVAAELNGELNYYPVVLDRLERNTAYTVRLTLLGPGSSDPDTPVEKSSLGVTVETQPWTDGGVIDSEI